MGRECVCTARFSWIEKGKAREGKALLEENEIVFRSEPRVKLTRADIASLVVQKGELVVQTPLGSARFGLGEREAEKWFARYHSPPSLVKKLGIEPGHSVCLMGPIPVSVTEAVLAVATRAKTVGPNVHAVLLAAETASGLAKAPQIAEKLPSTARLWILYPKGDTRIPESAVRKVLLATGLVDTKTAKVDETWTSLQFVVRKADRLARTR